MFCLSGVCCLIPFPPFYTCFSLDNLKQKFTAQANVFIIHVSEAIEASLEHNNHTDLVPLFAVDMRSQENYFIHAVYRGCLQVPLFRLLRGLWRKHKIAECPVNRTPRVYIVCLYLTSHFSYYADCFNVKESGLEDFLRSLPEFCWEINLLLPPSAVLQSTGKAMGAEQWKYHRKFKFGERRRI